MSNGASIAERKGTLPYLYRAVKYFIHRTYVCLTSLCFRFDAGFPIRFQFNVCLKGVLYKVVFCPCAVQRVHDRYTRPSSVCNCSAIKNVDILDVSLVLDVLCDLLCRFVSCLCCNERYLHTSVSGVLFVTFSDDPVKGDCVCIQCSILSVTQCLGL